VQNGQFDQGDIDAQVRAAAESTSSAMVRKIAATAGDVDNMLALAIDKPGFVVAHGPGKTHDSRQIFIVALGRAAKLMVANLAKVKGVHDLQSSLVRCSSQQLGKWRLTTRNLGERLDRVRPGQILALRRAALLREENRLRERTRHYLRHLRQRREALHSRLQLLGPEQVLARGYSITMDAATGKIIRAKSQTSAGQLLKTRLHSGEIKSTIAETGEG